jgi:hypothetical protein
MMMTCKLEDMKKKYNAQFIINFCNEGASTFYGEAIQQLMLPPEKPKRPIGFPVKEHEISYKTIGRL